MNVNLPVIDPNLTSGSDLAALLNQWGVSVATTYFNPTIPDDLKQGQLFIHAFSPTAWQLKLCLDPVAFNYLTLMTFNPVIATVTFEGPVGSTYTGSYVDVSRYLGATGSLQGGGNLSANRSFQLVGDVPQSQVLPNYYYGRDVNNRIGWAPLPAAGASSATATPGSRQLRTQIGSSGTFTVPSGVNSIWLQMWGGGGSSTASAPLPGGSMSGSIPVSPGDVLTLVAGVVSTESRLTTPDGRQFVTPAGVPDGTGPAGVSAPSGANIMPAAPLMAMDKPWGQVGNSGCVWIEWIA